MLLLLLLLLLLLPLRNSVVSSMASALFRLFGCEPHRLFDRLYYTPPMTEINPNALLCFALLW